MVSPMTQTVSDAAQLKILPLIAKELGVGPQRGGTMAMAMALARAKQKK